MPFALVVWTRADPMHCTSGGAGRLNRFLPPDLACPYCTPRSGSGGHVARGLPAHLRRFGRGGQSPTPSPSSRPSTVWRPAFAASGDAVAASSVADRLRPHHRTPTGHRRGGADFARRLTEVRTPPVAVIVTISPVVPGRHDGTASHGGEPRQRRGSRARPPRRAGRSGRMRAGRAAPRSSSWARCRCDGAPARHGRPRPRGRPTR